MNVQSWLQVGLFLQVSGITPGRAAAIQAGIVGLISVLIGWLALVGWIRRMGYGRIMAIASLLGGLTGMILSGLHLARTTGGFGTGSGRAGAIVGLLLGLTGMVLGGLALRKKTK